MCLIIGVYFSPSNDAKPSLKPVFSISWTSWVQHKQLARLCSCRMQHRYCVEEWIGWTAVSHFGSAVSFQHDITWFCINGSYLYTSNPDQTSQISLLSLQLSLPQVIFHMLCSVLFYLYPHNPSEAVSEMLRPTAICSFEACKASRSCWQCWVSRYIHRMLMI